MMQNANILLVDDDTAYHVLVPDVLNPEGHTVDVVETMADARAYIARVAAGEAVCHAVVLDFHLDKNDGSVHDQNAYPVLNDIREQLGNDFPVIGFSGRSMDTFGITDIYVDATKDGVFDLPGIIDSIPDAPLS
jgi:DNA-binding response OmpR family regulator